MSYPKFRVDPLETLTIIAPGIHEDVGHTLVHFLCSAEYETINSPLEEGISDIQREYQRSVLVYQASRAYDIAGLEILAKRNIERLGEDMSMLDILQATRDVLLSLPKDETWLPDYVKRNLQQLLKAGRSDFDYHKFCIMFDQDHHFNTMLMEMLIEIQQESIRLLSSHNISEKGKSHRREDDHGNRDELSC